MIYSMTGFASATRELATAALNVELRSVNHRYLDLQFRLPEELRARLISIGLWITRTSMEIRIAGQGSLDALIEVNSAIRDGLR